jgi:hypothetical protein
VCLIAQDKPICISSFIQVHYTLDPLLAALNRDYIDDNDLSFRLQSLFKAS